MKKNFLFGLIGAGALILSGSVGFAAWTITNPSDSKEDTSLKITADGTVTDARFVIDTIAWDNRSVQFKPVKEDQKTYTHNWLSASDVLPAEALGTSYTITGKAPEGTKLQVSAELTDETKADPTNGVKTYAELAGLGHENTDGTGGKGVVSALPKATVVFGSTPSNSITVDHNGQFSATASLQFGWGAAFGGKNPYEFYNNKAYSPELAELAKTNIEYLKYLPKCSFKLKFTVSLASN